MISLKQLSFNAKNFGHKVHFFQKKTDFDLSHTFFEKKHIYFNN